MPIYIRVEQQVVFDRASADIVNDQRCAPV